MGVYHFMGVGRSVGAVTCAVDYIEKALQMSTKPNPPESIQRLLKNSGGINHSEKNAGSIEALVLFSSPEVVERKLAAFDYIGNASPCDVRTEIEQALVKIWKSFDPKEKRKVYWCKLNINNFQECLQRVIRVTYHFSAPNRQGKEIWCNLTGGANVINLALMSMAQLTNKSSKQYIITQGKEYEKFINVPNAIAMNPNIDSYFNVFPFIQTSIDQINVYKILELLKENPLTTNDLYSRYKNFNDNLDLRSFTQVHMTKIYGQGYTNRDRQTDINSITREGLDFLEQMDNLIIDCHMPSLYDDPNFDEDSKTWLDQSTI
ncbi:hypothetical protein [Herpetosiphon geysericola]|uniref:CRISPR-associated protein n=1 Tax=Herpetosiphon geysericola TaxID=70996 RepID=A0A0N8GR47_9CHLR|nr:hypothetical protein [Herpetosiphon geysericola]KPL85490.1 hypothetical protein SE18_17870 [Herpetosiphon geysericola]